MTIMVELVRNALPVLPRARIHHARSWALCAVLAWGCSAPATAPAAATHGAAPAQHDTPASALPRPTRLPGRGLDAAELKIVTHVDRHMAEAEALLERLVNINSGTMNHEGVKQVAEIFAAELTDLGFETRWIPMAAANRSGHLFATRRGTGKHVLLIGHLDTVFEKDDAFQRYERLSKSRARGPGVVDMKGGDIVILYALRALHSIGALDGTTITVALLGDEESPGDPLSATRADFIEVAKQADIALGFEEGVGGANTATIARRGFTSWSLQVTGVSGHSSGVFSPDYGAGAIFEIARILHEFYAQLAGEKYLTFNAGVMLGGTEVEYAPQSWRGMAYGKSNVIPRGAMAYGGLRTLTEEQRERAKDRMRAIVAANLPRTSAEIRFVDQYPPMAPTQGNQDLFDQLDVVSRDLGYGTVRAVDPGERGAADISFAAPHVDSLAGLGPYGTETHTPRESLELTSLPRATRRAAVFLYRLTR